MVSIIKQSKKNKTNKKAGYIYYTGYGAKPSGKHSVEEFLKIMNMHFGIECKKYKKTLKNRNCNVKEFIDYSGAEKIET